jgi:hypothetical protein
MSRKSIFEMKSPRRSRTTALTWLFDLLLLGGYAACGLLTYFLFLNGAAAQHARQATPLPVETAAPPGFEAPVPPPSEAPVEPAAPPPPAAPAPSEAAPAPPLEPGGKDLTAAMNAYVLAINKGKYADARAMRADPNIPSLEGLKKTKAMKLLAVVAYPRISRTQGSIWVKLKIDKSAGKPVYWRGRIDWESRNGRWMTVKWDSQAVAPDADEPAAAH